MPQKPRDLPPQAAKPEEPPDREVALYVAEAVLQLFLCDAEIESRSGELKVAQARLAAAASEPEAAPIASEVETAIGCLLDHLGPARQVVRSFEPICLSRTHTMELRTAAPKETCLRAGDHRLYQEFFAGIDEEAVAALRHREICPVCARMTRLLLFGFAPPRIAPTAVRT